VACVGSAGWIWDIHHGEYVYGALSRLPGDGMCHWPAMKGSGNGLDEKAGAAEEAAWTAAVLTRRLKVWSAKWELTVKAD